MKRLLFTIVCLSWMAGTHAQTAAITTWSVGATYTECSTNKVCYPIMVQTNTINTQLSFVTHRFLYDNLLMNTLEIANEQNGYVVELVEETTPTVGAEFGFSGASAAFPRISVSPNVTNYLDIALTPTHVYDLCFTMVENPPPSDLCSPLVYDYNHTSLPGIANDAGYFIGDAGIATQYVVDGMGDAIAADDEAINFLWIGDPTFVWPLDMVGETVGAAVTTNCIQTNCALPVELVSFRANKLGKKTELTWITESEIDNDHFEIQRSADGVHFEALGKVAGKGTTYSTSTYIFYDELPLIGKNYYRLKQVDLDGSFTFSEIRQVTFKSSGLRVDVFPNPSADFIYLNADLGTSRTESVPLKIEIQNLEGKVVRILDDVAVSQHYLRKIDIKNLASGVYMIRMQLGAEYLTNTFIKNTK